MRKMEQELRTAFTEAQEKLGDATMSIEKILTRNGEYGKAIDKAGRSFEELTMAICEKKKRLKSHPVPE